jgi:hypothetical protein
MYHKRLKNEFLSFFFTFLETKSYNIGIYSESAQRGFPEYFRHSEIQYSFGTVLK